MSTSVAAEGTAVRRRPLWIRTCDNSSDAGQGAAAAADGEKEEPLSPAGRMFHQPRFNCYIVAEMGSAVPVNVEALHKGLGETIARHPRFSSIPILDPAGGKKPRWVRTTVNVADHIIVPDLDVTWAASPDKLVEDYVSDLTTTKHPMKSSQPLWECHILNVQTSEAAAVVVLRIHHSLGDGMSLVSLLLACTRQTKNPDALPSITVPGHRGTTPQSNAVSTLLAWIFSFLCLAWHTLVDVVLFNLTACFLNDSSTPLKGLEGVEANRKRFVHRSMSLEDIRLVKKAMNCTVNDVLLAVTSRGLSRYLSRKQDESRDESTKRIKDIRMRCTLLVNIRKTPGIQELAEMMKSGRSKTRWGNMLGYIIMRVPVVMHSNPLDHVHAAKKVTDRKKMSLEALFTYKSANLILKFLGIKVAAWLSHRVLMHTTFSLSNIIGPAQQISFYGHPVVYMAPSVYGHPQALTVHYQSYMDTMRIVLAVDDTLISDPRQLLEDFGEALEHIRNAQHNLS